MSPNVTIGAGRGERTSVASGYLLGIDVGTTHTAAATCRGGPRHADTETVNLGDRSSAVPSVLFVGDEGSFVVGEAAERRATSDPGHVVREFKRRIGDPTPLLVGGRAWAPEDLSARLVQWVVDRVAQREGGPAARIAVTHPASWGSHKKDLLAGALHHHGLPATLLAGPLAAALHYAAAERVEPGCTIAVYDFGGGTFDAAVVHKEPQGFSLLGRPEGVDRLGGIDLDELVFEHVREGLPEAFEGLDETDPAVLAAVAAVRRECTEAKETLSADTEVSIPVVTPAGQGSVRLHRSEFEAMIRPRVEETVTALSRAISSAGVPAEQLTAVLLVGGSSRIPLVAQLVSEQLGRPVAVHADPKNAIAKGAALSLTPAGISATGAHLPGQRSGTFGPSAPVTVPVALLTPSARTGPQSTPQLPTSQWPTGAFATEAEPVAPTQRITTTRSPQMAPPPPPPPDWRAQDAEFSYAPQPARRSSPAVLVGAGGAAAAVLVLAAAFLWPRGETPTVAALASGPSAVATTTAAPPTTVAVEPTTQAAPPPKPVVQRTQPRIIVLPPITKTEAPPTTTPEPPPPTTTAKTTPTITTTPTPVTPPPSSTAPPTKVN